MERISQFRGDNMKTVRIRDAVYEEAKRIVEAWPAFYRDINEFVQAGVISEIRKSREMAPRWERVKGKK
jgi:hypothetical protein